MQVLLALCVILSLWGTPVCQAQNRVCQGTNVGRISTGDPARQYIDYRSRYTNCVIVAGNLELTHLNVENNYDFDFLHTIEEVTGYVLIVDVVTTRIALDRLRIIRGWSLYSDRVDGSNPRYSLYVAINQKPNSQTYGLRELGLSSLSEITTGDVFIHDNFLLCYVDTINWSDIISVKAKYSSSNVSPSIKKTCGQCDSSCAAGCWGNGTNHCQQLSRVNCAEQCYDSSTGIGRCFGLGPNQCCHSQCAAGCTGPKNTECLVCAKFNNSGSCVDRCPEQYVYDPQKHIEVPNPDFRYTYSTLCLNECPEHLWISGDQCVVDCGSGRIPNDKRVCISCEGACPKECDGTGEDYLNSENVFQFAGCTKVKGRLRILDLTFSWHEYEWMEQPMPPLEIEQLSMLRDITEVTHDVFIQANISTFTSLDFLGNLTYIRGQGRLSDYSLSVEGTSLRLLGLKSLKSTNGNVKVTSNRQMCLAETIDWKLTNIVPRNYNPVIGENRPPALCAADGIVCDSECLGGCWDVGSNNCVACKNYLYNGTCVATCNVTAIQYSDSAKNCFDCDPECRLGCRGPGRDNCTACKHFRDGPYCVNKCPLVKYNDNAGVCQPCAQFCAGGCTGPKGDTVVGGCNSCHRGLILENKQYTARCIDPLTEECPDGYFERSARLGPMKNKEACFKCHSECTKCYGINDNECIECKNFHIEHAEGRTCLPHCDVKEHYADGKECKQCDEQCIGCRGNSSFDCLLCKTAKIYLLDDNGELTKEFNCTMECPDDLPYKYVEYTPDGHAETVCSASPRVSKALVLGIVIPVILALIIVAVIAVLVVRHWRQQSRKQKLLEPVAPEAPLDVTDASPDMSFLRLVKESELKKGAVIGSGAFGTVYKGFWVPAKESLKIPVAIKVLSTEGSVTEQNKELLDEARIMFSVNHVCCVRVIAICMAQQMMLITQLMPLGCLLDYVRKNKNHVGSRDLLTWSTQIAKGMEYLAHLGIVHRDLAARNVLVQKPNHVRITDFGLARLLEYKQEEYQAQSGKVPIKWLALESIRYRIFTVKTDVWSYGVTLWELFTFGQRPYENISAQLLLNHLEKGERLEQPEICTIDVYMIMIRCWMLDAGSRPTFKELGEEFAKMSRDPGRYLVVEGDKYKRLPSNHYKGGEELDANLHSLSIEMDDIPQATVSADDYLKTNQVGGDDLDIDIPQGDDDDMASSPHKQPSRVAMPAEEKLKGDVKGRRSPGPRSRYTSDPTRRGDRPPVEPPPPPPTAVAQAQRMSPKKLETSVDDEDEEDAVAAAAVPLLRGQPQQDDYLLPQLPQAPQAPTKTGKAAPQARDSEYLDPRKSQLDSGRGNNYLEPPRKSVANVGKSPPANSGRDSEYLEPRQSQALPSKGRESAVPNNRESEYLTPRGSASSPLNSSRDSEYLTPRNSQLADAEYLEPKKSASPPQKTRESQNVTPNQRASALPPKQRASNVPSQRQSREDDYQAPKPTNLTMYMDIVPDVDDEDDEPPKPSNGTPGSPNQTNPQYFSLGPASAPNRASASTTPNRASANTTPSSSPRKSTSPPPISAKPSQAEVARASARHLYPKPQPTNTEAEYINQADSKSPADKRSTAMKDLGAPQYLDMSGPKRQSNTRV